MHRLLVTVLAALPMFCSSLAQAQDSTVVVHQHSHRETRYARPERVAQNALYLELGGNGIFYTLNYERFIGDIMSIRAGIGYFAIGGRVDGEGGNVSTAWGPLMVNFFVGGPDHKMELGAGLLLMYVDGAVDTLNIERSGEGMLGMGTATIAYRYAPHDGGFSWKAGLTPVFGPLGFLPWGGVSFGVTM